jgi:hypothetical protein
MSRKVFFSFHFKRDAWRAGQVRNSDLLADEDEYGVIDGVEWEKIERQGEPAIERWIEDQLKYTSVTVVLIGAETAERDWVDHEIRRSWERGNALVGVRIHNVKNQDGKTDSPGPNPLDSIYLKNGARLSSVSKTYDWVNDDGRSNLGTWVEEAYNARKAYRAEEELRKTEASIPSSPTSVGRSAQSPAFAPRSPWCADGANGSG